MTAETKFSTEIHNPLTTLLIHAVVNDLTKLAKACISLGADVNVRGAGRNTLLHICQSAPMGSILLRGGAFVNAVNDLQQTPLHSSMRRAIVPLSKVLIRHNANLDAQEVDGTTPLDLAQDPDINTILLRHRANPNIQNKDGDTALHLALRNKGTPVVARLVKHGANREIRNNAGLNAIDELCLRIQRTERELEKMARALQPGWNLYNQKHSDGCFPNEDVKPLKIVTKKAQNNK